MQATDEAIFADVDPAVRAKFATPPMPVAAYWQVRASSEGRFPLLASLGEVSAPRCREGTGGGDSDGLSADPFRRRDRQAGLARGRLGGRANSQGVSQIDPFRTFGPAHGFGRCRPIGSLV